MTTLGYYLLGLALGAGSSVIPGPCGLAVIDAATRLGTQRAVATAIGSGLGDLFYAAVGVLGIGGVLASDRALIAAMVGLSGIVLIVYGVICVRWHPVARTTPAKPLVGLGIGFATLVCNPGALVTWSGMVGTRLVDATTAERVAAVVGIGCGSLAWFVGLAFVSAGGKTVLGPRLQRLVQVVGCLIVVYGAMSVARAIL